MATVVVVGVLVHVISGMVKRFPKMAEAAGEAIVVQQNGGNFADVAAAIGKAVDE